MSGHPTDALDLRGQSHLAREGYDATMHTPLPPLRSSYEECAGNYHTLAHESAAECRAVMSQLEPMPHFTKDVVWLAGSALARRDQALAAATTELVEQAAAASPEPVTESVTSSDAQRASDPLTG